MKPYADCGPCTLKWIYERLADPLSEINRFSLLRKLMYVLSTELEPSAHVAAISNICLEQVEEFFSASEVGYQRFKVKCNQAAQEALVRARVFIDKGKTPDYHSILFFLGHEF